MKKLFLMFACVAFVASLSFAQNDPTADSWTDNGNFVETTSKARVAPGSGGANMIMVHPTGAATSLNAGSTGSTFRISNNGGFKVQSQDRADVIAGLGASVVKILEIEGTAPAESFNIDANGNVGLGVAIADITQRLTVDGTVLAEEAKVILDVTAPDYVFAKDYNLRSLEEVEAYVNEHSHLPEIPSAAEFAEDGVKLGQMSFDLLKKVEELTLYMIEMKKENEELKARITELEDK